MKIVIDLDSTLCDLMTPWLALYNEKYSDHLTMDQITDWDTGKFTKPECGRKIFDLLCTSGLYRNLKPISGALPVVEKWRREGHRIVLATSACKSFDIAKQKLEWIEQRLPLQKAEDIFFGTRKQIFDADVLIDDAPQNAKTFREANPGSLILTLGYGYNDVPEYDFRSPPGERDDVAWLQFDMYLRAFERGANLRGVMP